MGWIKKIIAINIWCQIGDTSLNILLRIGKISTETLSSLSLNNICKYYQSACRRSVLQYGPELGQPAARLGLQ